MAKKDGIFCISPKHAETLVGTDTATYCAYLIMSCGTGGDNSTTAWSAKAVATYAGCRWGTANDAIAKLLELGIVERDEARSGPRSPKYRIQEHDTKSEDAIWLPTSLVTGATDKPPYPLENLRSTYDTLTIRLLLSFYENQNLIDDGGVDPSLLREEWESELVGERGAVRAWRFNYRRRTVSHAFSDGYKCTDSKGKPSCQPFWDRLTALEGMGLVEPHRMLKERVDGEPLTVWGRTPEELDAYFRLNTHALNDVCAASILEQATDWVFPVMAHIKAPVLQGGFRLKFRPHTKRTAAWWAQTLELNKRYLNRFGLLSKEPQKAPEKASGQLTEAAFDFDP